MYMKRPWQVQGLGVLLAGGMLAGIAWGDTMEIVTYYPAPTSSDQVEVNRLHANRATIGTPYSPANVPTAAIPDGNLLVFNRIGIGTIVPGTKLHVNDLNMTVASGNANQFIFTTDPPAVDIGGSLALGGRVIAAGAQVPFGYLWGRKENNTPGNEAGYLAFGTRTAGAANERMRITSAGNVGIGTVNPTALVGLGGEVARTIQMERRTAANTAGNLLLLRAGGATVAATNRTGGDLFLSSGVATGTGSSNIFLQTATAGAAGTADRIPTTKVTILGNGNVGIGTAAPNWLLEVFDDVNSGRAMLSRDAGTQKGTLQFGRNTGATVLANIAGHSSVAGATVNGLLTMGVANNVGTLNERFRMDDTYTYFRHPSFGDLTWIRRDGYVRLGGPVGISRDPSSTFMLDVNGSIATRFSRTYFLGSDGAGYHWLMAGGTAEPQRNALGFQMGPRIVQIGPQWTFNAVSDVGLKRDVETIPNALERVSQLRGVNFRWADPEGSSRLHMGVIGQEVEGVFPELVYTDPNGMKSVAYLELMGALVESIKELKSENDQLKGKTETLEWKVRQMEKQLTSSDR